MRESVQTAVAYIRSRAESFGLSDNRFEQQDIHIHIPEGAVPKDGPSAGITVAHGDSFDTDKGNLSAKMWL